MLDIKEIEKDILEGPYPDNVKDQVIALVSKVKELECNSKKLKPFINSEVENKKPIPQVQCELVGILENISLITVNNDDVLSKQAKSNAIELLKRTVSDLDKHKNK